MVGMVMKIVIGLSDVLMMLGTQMSSMNVLIKLMSAGVIVLMLCIVTTETWEAASKTSEYCGWLVVLLLTLMALHHSIISVNSISLITTLLTLALAVCWNTFRFLTLKGLSVA